MRDVIVHYHFFKNAGSSVDKLLKSAFAEDWLSFDPPHVVSPRELDEVIDQNPSKRAFSSHMLVPPVAMSKHNIVPILFLREPISRVRSAWLFEWKKQVGSEKPIGSLAEYIEEKFQYRRRNAIENFQTIKLSNEDYETTRANEERTDSELFETARGFLDGLKAFGLVEEFDLSMGLFQREYGSFSNDLCFEATAENVTQDILKSVSERHSEIESEIGADLFEELVSRNQLDVQLYAYALGRFKDLIQHESMEETKYRISA